MAKSLHVLIVEDSEDDMIMLVRHLKSCGYEPLYERVETREDMLAALESQKWDLIISDYSMPRFSGPAALETLKQTGKDIPFLISSGTIGEETAVDAMRSGCNDYFMKTNLTRMGPAIDRELKEAKIRAKHRKAEKALVESEIKYKTLVEQLPAIVYTAPLYNPGITLYASPQVKNIFGFTQNEWMADPRMWEKRIHPDDHERVMKDYSDAVARKQSIQAEYRMIKKDGSVIWVRDTASIVENPGNTPPYLLGMYDDITSLKTGQLKLAEQFRRITLLNQIARALAERQDLQSILNVVIDYLEKNMPLGFCAAYGYHPETKFLNLIAYSSHSPENVPELKAPEGMSIDFDEDDALWKAMIQNKRISIPDTSQRPERRLEILAKNNIHALEVILLIVGAQPLGVLAVGRREPDSFYDTDRQFLKDVSEHVSLAVYHLKLYDDLKEAYQKLTDNQQAALQQERLKALGQMASGIVHDINNALSPILGFSDILLAEKNLSKDTHESLTFIKTAGQDISQIISRMREFYRKRDEDQPMMALNLNAIVKQVIALTRPRWKDMPEKNGIFIEMTMDLMEGMPRVTGIESELREALINLIFNAVDALPRGGGITVRTSTRGDSPETRRLMLEVTDTGIGMDGKTKMHCLEPFFTTKGVGGTGLGLAMVFGVVQRHEGVMEIESELEKGTTFRLVFPVLKPSEEVLKPAEPGKPIHSLRILHIDDDERVRKCMKVMLEKDGHTVATADGGQAGIDAFFAAKRKGEPFDAIITDFGMPQVDGRKVIETIKQEGPTTPIILMSGWGYRMGAMEDQPDGVDAIVSKPPTLATLRDALRKVVR